MAPGLPVPVVRRGPRYWLSSYGTMVRWHLAALRLWLPLIIAIQILAGSGFVLGLALFFNHIPASAALFVSTGVPVINLVMVGLILGPQLVAEQRMRGTYEFLRTMPAPRAANALAWYTVTLAGGLPAVLVSLLVAEMRYDLTLSVSPAVVVAVLLTAFTGTMMGYALAHAWSEPMGIRLITQLLVFVVFGFSPILYPVGQLPGWLAAVNWWLPFRHMAVIVRAGLTSGVVTGVAGSYLMVCAWGAACTAIALVALGRRT